MEDVAWGEICSDSTATLMVLGGREDIQFWEALLCISCELCLVQADSSGIRVKGNSLKKQ